MEKKIMAELEKCYSIAPLMYQGKPHFLVAAEKKDRCILFDSNGREETTIWEGPGGAMSMVQIPGSDGEFLATHQFYSPNDSKEAKIILATPSKNGSWTVRTLVNLPFVHRFDILTAGGKNYLFACTLKSGHEYKEDWSSPGKVYVAELPDDLSSVDEDHPLSLEVIREGLLKNHGYYRVTEDGNVSALVCSAQGVFRFYPPEQPDKAWREEQLLDLPASDAVLFDLDEDGEKELIVISPFHGDEATIYKEITSRCTSILRKQNFFTLSGPGNWLGSRLWCLAIEKVPEGCSLLYGRARVIVLKPSTMIVDRPMFMDIPVMGEMG